MKSKGFTLIELLAVIVILAIVALIATPIILNIISDSKEESNKRSIEMYAKAIQNANALKQLDGSVGIVGRFDTSKLEDKLKVQYEGNVVCDIIEVYANGTMYLEKCKINGQEVKYTYGKKASFADDSWDTIAANVKAGYMYNVGDTKEVSLTNFTNKEKENETTYTVRIANTSTPSECNIEGFSQSACGFVVEFADIITEYRINSTATNVGGYPASDMYKYIKNDIYNSLPKNLKDVIINTKIVSSHGGTSGEENFTSIDKLYLLSTKEVRGSGDYDTSADQTRQLDYYKDVAKVTTSSYFGAIKNYNESSSGWWLRSAKSNSINLFFCVSDIGGDATSSVIPTRGVAPAFRIG